MKKTFILSFDYDESKNGIAETFGTTTETVESFLKDAFGPTEKILSKIDVKEDFDLDTMMTTKTQDTITVLEAWKDRPDLGAVILSLLAQRIGAVIERKTAQHAMSRLVPGMKSLIDGLKEQSGD